MDRLSQAQIQELQNDVLNVMTKVDRLKYQMRTEENRQINTYLQHAIRVLRNMSNREKVAPAGDFNSRNSSTKLVYNPDGSTKLVHTSDFHTTGDGWEHQFDERMLVRAPVFMVPPQSKTMQGGSIRRY
jgi:hypothetical protein